MWGGGVAVVGGNVLIIFYISCVVLNKCAF